MGEREPRLDVRVRAMEAADWRALHELWSQPGVIWGTLQMPYQSAEAVRKRIEDSSERSMRLVAETDGRVVGSAGLHPGRSPRRQHSGALGMMVHPDYWNRGVGTALLTAIVDLADNWLRIIRLELTVYTDNPAARHLYEKFGFVVEGMHRAYALRNGAYVDAYCMARLREPVSAGGTPGT
jgi:putative acetyltransferase